MITQDKWKWFGIAGHFICSHYCRFHLCTQVGKYLISTVGEYVPPEGVREILAKSRGIELKGKGDVREADYLKKLGYETLGAWIGDPKNKPIYETIVFIAGKPCDREDCQCGLPAIDGQELDATRSTIRGDAIKIHMDFCQEYANEEKK